MEILFEDEARALTKNILEELTARCGFDTAWGACTQDVQFEIMAELQKICIRAFHEGKKKRNRGCLTVV